MNPLINKNPAPGSLKGQSPDNTATVGTMQGLAIFPQTVTNPEIKNLAPSITNPHSDIELESLPKSLAKIAGGLKALEVNLCDVFFVSTETELFELNSLFFKSKINCDEIIIRFSFILTLISQVNCSNNKNGVDNQTIEIIKKCTAILLPDLVKNLLDLWEKKKGVLKLGLASLKPRNKDIASTKIKEMTEAFGYLEQLFNDNQLRFDILGTSTIHIKDSDTATKTTIRERLEQMLKIHKAVLRSFDHNQSFWITANPDFNEIYPLEARNRKHQLIQKRFDQENISQESVINLYESLDAYWRVIGNIHTRTLRSIKKRGDNNIFNEKLGFFPQLFKELESELGLKDHDGKRTNAYAMIVCNIPAWVQMHSRYAYIISTINYAAIAQAIRNKGSTIDMEAVDQIILESKKIATFFSNLKSKEKNRAIYTNGTQKFSFSDVALHIENITATLEELKNSSNDYSASILYSTVDLNGSINLTLKSGLDNYLNFLQTILEDFKMYHKTSSLIDNNQVEVIFEHIKAIGEMISIIDEKSPVIDQLAKRIFSPQLPKEKKTPARKSKHKKTGRKKGQHKSPPKTEHETQLFTKEEKQEVISPFQMQPEEEPKDEILPIEEVTEKLISTVANLQKNLAVEFTQEKRSNEKPSNRNVKWKNLRKELEKAGFQLLRTTGSHKHFKHPKAPEVGLATVPVHSEKLSIGVVKDVREKIALANEKT